MAYDVKEANCWPVNEQGEIVFQSGRGTGNIVGTVPSTAIPVHPDTGRVLFSGAPLPVPHRCYHFHGYAGQQLPDDGVFRDISGLANHAVRGVDLSIANAWANSGYVSTVAPATGVTDSVLRIPPLNFDYTNGEKLILWWCGSVTPGGSDATLLGDTNGSLQGVRVRAKSTGKLDIALYGAGAVSRFGSASTATVFDGTSHSFGIMLDGSTKKYGFWVDDEFDTTFGASYVSFSSGQDADTRNPQTFNLGCGAQKSLASTEGIASKTRGLVILKLTAEDVTPSVISLTNMFKQLRNNPSRQIMDGTI